MVFPLHIQFPSSGWGGDVSGIQTKLFCDADIEYWALTAIASNMWCSKRSVSSCHRGKFWAIALKGSCRRKYRDSDGSAPVNKILNLLYHFFVMSAVGLVAAGGSAYSGGTSVKQSDVTLLKIGVLMMLIAWTILAAWAIISLRSIPEKRMVRTYANGTKVPHYLLLLIHSTNRVR
jgi:hypothetical protein